MSEFVVCVCDRLPFICVCTPLLHTFPSLPLPSPQHTDPAHDTDPQQQQQQALLTTLTAEGNPLLELVMARADPKALAEPYIQGKKIYRCIYRYTHKYIYMYVKHTNMHVCVDMDVYVCVCGGGGVRVRGWAPQGAVGGAVHIILGGEGWFDIWCMCVCMYACMWG